MLLYKYEADSDSLTLDLKLSDLTDHKGLRTKSSRDQHDYFEVPSDFLHDITSSTNITISEADKEFLNDFLESISDYSSTYTTDGYILLQNYYLADNSLHCTFEYYLHSNDQIADSIDFVINLNRYAPNDVVELDCYLDEFSIEVANAFE